MKSKTKALDKISRSYPSVSFDSMDLPEIKNWEVGKKYNLKIEAELVELSKGGYFEEDNKKEYHARFKIKSVKNNEQD